MSLQITCLDGYVEEDSSKLIWRKTMSLQITCLDWLDYVDLEGCWIEKSQAKSTHMY